MGRTRRLDLLRDVPPMSAPLPVAPLQSDGTPARAHVVAQRVGPAHRPANRCQHTTTFHVVYALDYGLRDSDPVGPVFSRPEEAAAFCRTLNGEEPRGAGARPSASAVRRAPAPAPDREPEGSPAAGPSPAMPATTEKVLHQDGLANETATDPVTASWPVLASPGGSCIVCGTPLPVSRQHRRTCSTRCRVRASRLRRAEGGHEVSRPAGRTPASPGQLVFFEPVDADDVGPAQRGPR